LIKILIEINSKKNYLFISIEDNGKGIEKEKLETIQSPFYTTKKERKKKVGLGLPLFKMNAELTGGFFKIDSEIGKGTKVEALFTKDNIDRQPLGRLYDTIIALIFGHSNIEFIIKIANEDKVFELNTLIIKKELDGLSITHPDVIRFIEDYIKEGFNEIGLSTEMIY
jgi:signal transduction histidine kinase